jgi:hypothetical protein
MLISKKKHIRIITHLANQEDRLILEIQRLQSRIEHLETLNTDDLIEHQINKYMNRMEVERETT